MAQSAAFTYLCILEIAGLQISSIFRGVFLEGPRIVEQFKASDEVVLEGDEGCSAADTEGRKRRRMAVWTRWNVDGILDCGAADAVPAKGSPWIQAHRLLLARKRHGCTAHRQSADGLLRRLYHPVSRWRWWRVRMA